VRLWLQPRFCVCPRPGASTTAPPPPILQPSPTRPPHNHLGNRLLGRSLPVRKRLGLWGNRQGNRRSEAKAHRRGISGNIKGNVRCKAVFHPRCDQLIQGLLIWDRAMRVQLIRAMRRPRRPRRVIWAHGSTITAISR